MSLPANLLGSRVLGIEDLTRPWASGVRTSLATLEDGRRVVHQEGAPTVAGRAGIARRIRYARVLRSAAPGLPVPEVLDGDSRANPPFAVTSYIAGESGDAILTTPAGAARLGGLAGSTAVALAAVPALAFGRSLPRVWADPGRLAIAAAGWLLEAVLLLHPPEAETARAVIGRIPGLLAASPVVAHGDLAPAQPVGQQARGWPESWTSNGSASRPRSSTPPGSACWSATITRSAGGTPGPPLLAALGLPDDEATAAVMDDLAVLGCLEMLAALPRRSPGRLAWATRARERLAVRR